MPYSNELGLRMLIAGAVREASVLGYHFMPLFSYYSYHGPVFRVLLCLNRGKSPNNRHYSFISYCIECGNSQAIMWDKLGQISCSCNAFEDCFYDLPYNTGYQIFVLRLRKTRDKIMKCTLYICRYIL